LTALVGSISRGSRCRINRGTVGMQFYSRAVLLVVAVTIAALSVVPPAWRPVTGVPHAIEHAVIFGLAGASLALSFARNGLALAIVVAAFTGLVEIAQLWVPGRHARLSDFAVDTAAAWMGLGLCAILRRLRQEPR
jgi:VanZ family protein